MYKKKLDFKDRNIIVPQLCQAINETVFIMVHVLYYQYHIAVTRIQDMIREFEEFSKLYANGLTDEHMEKYFEEIEGIAIVNKETYGR